MRESWRLLWRDIRGALKPEAGELEEYHRLRMVPGVFVFSLFLLLPLIVEHNVFGQLLDGRASYERSAFSADRTTLLLGGRRMTLAPESALGDGGPMYVVFCSLDRGEPISGVAGRFSGILMRSEERPECGLFTGRWLPTVLLALLLCTLMSLTRFRWLQVSALYLCVVPAFSILLLSLGWLLNMPFRLLDAMI